MKKFTRISLLGIGLIICLLMTACDETTPENENSSAQEPIVWKMESAFGSGDIAWDVQMPMIKEVIETVTEGKVTVEMYEPDTLCAGDDIPLAVKNGTLDAGLTSAATTCSIVPQAYAETLPPFFTMTKEESYDIHYNTELYDYLYNAYADAGLIYAAYIPAGSLMLASTFEITEPDDFKGHIVRAVGANADYFDLCGASTTFISGGDLYMALKLGTIEATNWDLGGLMNMGFNEVCSYCIPCYNAGGFCCMVINPDSFAALDEQMQQDLIDALRELFWDLYAESEKLETEALKAAPDAGVTITELTEEQQKTFLNIGITYIDQMKERYPDAAEGFQMVLDWKTEALS